jgi:hypothetical protein
MNIRQRESLISSDEVKQEERKLEPLALLLLALSSAPHRGAWFVHHPAHRRVGREKDF